MKMSCQPKRTIILFLASSLRKMSINCNQDNETGEGGESPVKHTKFKTLRAQRKVKPKKALRGEQKE
jgi:hypothetical protein